MNDHDHEALRRLVIYAADIYHQTTMTKPSREWKPCDDVCGLLSQLSNTLREIHDSVIDTHAALGAFAEIAIQSKDWPKETENERHRHHQKKYTTRSGVLES